MLNQNDEMLEPTVDSSNVNERVRGNMRKTQNAEHTMTTFLLGAVALLSFGYILAKNLPDIVRIIKISRM